MDISSWVIICLLYENGNFGAIFQPSKCSMFALKCSSSHAEHRTHVRDVRCLTLPKFNMFNVRIFDVRSNTRPDLSISIE